MGTNQKTCHLYGGGITPAGVSQIACEAAAISEPSEFPKPFVAIVKIP